MCVVGLRCGRRVVEAVEVRFRDETAEGVGEPRGSAAVFGSEVGT